HWKRSRGAGVRASSTLIRNECSKCMTGSKGSGLALLHPCGWSIVKRGISRIEKPHRRTIENRKTAP
ncbi:MAG: hypothetical protein KIT18_16690, partial [Burkholderiales bacterium]|nr:hypothetical protein [Burkholderiales bacterium]